MSRASTPPATPAARAARPWAWPLVPVYRAAQRLEDALRREQRLPWPVVSVGSLSTGGAGKTPVVIALVNLLRAAGWHADVLTRGYGRESSGVQRVRDLEYAAAAALTLSTDELLARLGPLETESASSLPRRKERRIERRVLVDRVALEYGDEAVLIAARTGAPVWVGSSRFEAGVAAERELNGEDFDPQVPSHRAAVSDRCVHVLDDGFQHRQLARSFEVVLVTAADFVDAPMPAGNLREPLTSLARADAVVVRDDEIGELKAKVWPLLRPGAQVWTVRRRLRFPAPLGVLTAGLRPLAFCAIARPEGFAASLQAAGCGVVDTVVFRDHQPLHARELSEIVAFAKQLKASGLVTTEKDFVKLAPAALQSLWREVGPVCVAALDAEFGDTEPILAALENKLRGPAA